MDQRLLEMTVEILPEGFLWRFYKLCLNNTDCFFFFGLFKVSTQFCAQIQRRGSPRKNAELHCFSESPVPFGSEKDSFRSSATFRSDCVLKRVFVLILDVAAWTPPSRVISSICPFFWRTHFQSSKCFDGLPLGEPKYCYTRRLAFHKAPTVKFWEWGQRNLPTGALSNVKILRILIHHTSLRHIWNVRISLLPWNSVCVCARAHMHENFSSRKN